MKRTTLLSAGSIASVLGIVGFVLTEFAKLPGVPLPAWVLGLVGIIGAAVAANSVAGADQVVVSKLPLGIRDQVYAHMDEKAEKNL